MGLSSSTSFNTSFDMCSVQLIFSILRHTMYLHFKGFQSCDVLLSHSPYFCTVQGHTSNQCFHHSFLEASSFFSILPLGTSSPRKAVFSPFLPGGGSPGGGVAPPPFWGRGVRREGCRGFVGV